MLGNLLQTKLYIPRKRPSLVPRPHLIAKLNRGLHRKLTLISAPAGFGKTTLVSEWIADGKRPFAWLSLDKRDGDLSRFLTYLIAALQTHKPALGEKALAMLESPEPPPSESILTTLLNEIAAIPDEFALVLDDYHVLDAAPPIDQALTFLLEHLPPQMHLVITTREDPPLPLSRLRVRGLLTELRVADLRFTVAETAVFLHKVTGLAFSTNEIAALEKRTEGWIAGLQLAAISMQGRADVPGFIKAFAGDDRYIVDYLVDEVLRRQPEHIRRFLLQTSILDRLSGPLCEAVTNQEEGGALLEILERSNLFVIPLDDKRQWYRYHHLFGDVLQAHLMKEQPEATAALHQRASGWYEGHGLTAAAVYHAFAADDMARAARIIELAWGEMDRNRQAAEWLGWAKKLPDALVLARPVLSVGYAWAFLDTGQMEAAEMWLRQAEHCLATTTDFVVADEAEFQYLPGSIASARTYHALALGDMAGTIKYAHQALDFFPAEEYLRRGTPAALLGLAAWASGDLTEAIHAFTEAMTDYQKAGNTLFVITGAYVLADMKVAQGHLREAIKVCQEAIQLAEAQGEPVLRGAADLYTGLCELSLAQNDLEAAKAHLLRSQELGEDAALPRWSYRWHLAQAGVKAAEGNLDDALDALDEAERQYVRGPVPDVRTLAALKARLWVQQGRLANAQNWADEQGLSVDDDLSYLHEFDHITLARLLIARYRHGQEENCLQGAVALLERLRQAAEAGGRMGSVLEILVQQAMAAEAQGHIAEALIPLEQALTLGEPEGCIRTFVDAGPPLAKLLARMKAEGRRQKAYVSQLLVAFGMGKVIQPSAASVQPLVEPLSERELEVLQLVAEGLSNREIAERLFVALSTVKGHNRVIYGKLNVSRRTEAVARARELGLL
ncbi:MAG: helix-turn-helix transcriptional regulator [Chloroflexi bacterium]|nr:helix-turn-helix transcriptional regulator [Chloroflexota bacterium]